MGRLDFRLKQYLRVVFSLPLKLGFNTLKKHEIHISEGPQYNSQECVLMINEFLRCFCLALYQNDC